jgi:hypothetical protein
MEIAKDKVGICGHYRMEVLRADNIESAKSIMAKYGADSPEFKAIPRHLEGISESDNRTTNEMLKRILDTVYHGTTQISPWYVGLFNTNTTPDGSETYDVPVFTEDVDYSSATRPEYVEAAASGAYKTTNTASPATFTIVTGGQTIYGAALFSTSTKGDHTAGANNVLGNCAKFGTSRAVIATDVLNITYEITAGV